MRWSVAQWFEKRWWQRYLNKLEPGNYLDWKRQYWQTFIADLELTVHPGDQVLDAGCGPAGIFIALKHGHITATDPLLAHYSTLGHFNPADYPNARFMQGKIEDMEFTGLFDLVFCINAINHVDDMDAALDALIGSLKTGGELILSIDCHKYVWPKLFLRLLPLDILHPHQYGLGEYEHALAGRRMKVVRTIRLKSGFLFDYHALVCEKV